MWDTFGLVRAESGRRLTNLGHQKASIASSIHLIAEWAEKSSENAPIPCHTRLILLRARLDALEIMHVQATLTAEAVVGPPLALTARIPTC